MVDFNIIYKLKIVIIILIILILVVLFKDDLQGNEKYISLSDSKSQLSIESIQNITSIYKDISGTARFRNLYITGSVNLFPTGLILAYNKETPPPGWALCDGQKYKLDSSGIAIIDVSGIKTPDLRGRFIRMSYTLTGDRNNDTYLGDTVPVKVGRGPDGALNEYIRGNGKGEAKMTEHIFDDYGGSDYRIQTINEMPQHSHNLLTKTGNNNRAKGGDNGGACESYQYTDNTISAGNNKPMGIQPPYYVLTYIMKI